MPEDKQSAGETMNPTSLFNIMHTTSFKFSLFNRMFNYHSPNFSYNRISNWGTTATRQVAHCSTDPTVTSHLPIFVSSLNVQLPPIKLFLVKQNLQWPLSRPLTYNCHRLGSPCAMNAQWPPPDFFPSQNIERSGFGTELGILGIQESLTVQLGSIWVLDLRFFHIG